MSQDSYGYSIIIAAVILGLSIVGSSYLVSTSIDHAQVELQNSFARIRADAPAPVREAAAPRPKRPDPAKAYEVAVGEAPFRGPANAAVTIVEFSDFQCPFCGRVVPTLGQIHEEYGDQVRIAFKHMPLSFHTNAPAAHAAAEAAHRQGKFWVMHDKIYANQRDLSPATFEQYAAEIGLDIEKFKQDAASKAVASRIDADIAQAGSLGVTGTPGFFVNGRFLSGAQPFAAFKKLIDQELKEKS